MSADVGQRIKAARQRAGMSRPVLAGLVGRSAEWLKAIEVGRLQVPRLPMLVKLARALDISDLAELTGNGAAIPVRAFAGGVEHAALSEVQAALTAYRLTPDPRPAGLPHLAERLAGAWRLRHASPDHRTQVGTLLPDLIRDAQNAVRAHTDADRRQARRILAGVYRLAQFYTAYQPAPELVWLVADRSLSEAQDADDPYAIASGAWGLVQTLRESGRWDEALQVAEDGREQLAPHLTEGADEDWYGLYGALFAESSLTHARRGKHGLAWREWERAHGIARKLGPGYRHTQSSFGLPVVGAHAVSIAVDLQHTGEALQAAHTVAPETITSIPRRSRHLIEVARAHHKRGDRAASLATLERAERTASETARYNGSAREMAVDLLHSPPAGQGDATRELAGQLGLLTR
ncbi:transcriptional regulator with XRE-family HTH domain [Saccharopolyspora lacisalsi]|uniref:Transcriptional regulator with XRE-family HTH domain n=1 Tax=Halosaccharopolyspora lacisalsi TaxID=1000566 RepID=A0A839DWE7_9PSEU|nr:helix-turn-helix domain-containing protein [Halosaccharopolyspora lacisalsi]MBA8825210.1 transcriptional regulator with XRE-family HTH domain [Halosaccharopolyspora lacisalsi]